jgi:hypothetical protein
VRSVPLDLLVRLHAPLRGGLEGGHDDLLFSLCRSGPCGGRIIPEAQDLTLSSVPGLSGWGYALFILLVSHPP